MVQERSYPSSPTRLVEASRLRIAQAYHAWWSKRGRAERESGTNSAKMFTAAVIGQLDTTRQAPPSRIGLPTTRQSFSNWKKGLCKPTVRVRLDVCQAIFSLAQVDVTENGFLENSVINSTDMVTLGEVTNLSGEISVASVEFHSSSAKAVWMAVTKDKPSKEDERSRIGSVVYVLREAAMLIDGETTNLSPVLVRLSDGQQIDVGQSYQAEIFSETSVSLKWRIQPTHPKTALQSSLRQLRLCEGLDYMDPGLTLKILARKCDIEPSLSLEKTIPNYSGKHENVRKKLIEQVLRNRIPENGMSGEFVLSQSKVSPL